MGESVISYCLNDNHVNIEKPGFKHPGCKKKTGYPTSFFVQGYRLRRQYHRYVAGRWLLRADNARWLGSTTRNRRGEAKRRTPGSLNNSGIIDHYHLYSKKNFGFVGNDKKGG